jgi:hypothetical protein
MKTEERVPPALRLHFIPITSSLFSCFTDGVLFDSHLGHNMDLPTAFIHLTLHCMFLNQLN